MPRKKNTHEKWLKHYVLRYQTYPEENKSSPYIWLDDEYSGSAFCGCTINEEHNGSSSSAFVMCKEHYKNYLIEDDAILAECLVAAFGGILHPAPPPLMTPDQLGRAIEAFRTALEIQAVDSDLSTDVNSGLSKP